MTPVTSTPRAPAPVAPPSHPAGDVAPWGRSMLAAGGALIGAGLLAAAMVLVYAQAADVPERAVMRAGLLVVGAAALVPALGFALGGERRLSRLAQHAVLGLLVGLAGTYLFHIWSVLSFRGDILLWSESEFVGDLIKLREGYPLFTAPANIESFNYPPATQGLTYLLHLLVVGTTISVPVLRGIQLGYAVASAVVATLAVRELLLLRGDRSPVARAAVAAGVLGLFLAATNSITNPYVYYLHDDSLAQLLSTLTFWCLVRHERTGSRGALVALALLPAAGFLAKQSLAIWGPLAGAYLLFCSARLRRPQVIAWGVAAAGLLVVVMGGGFLLWGTAWKYWIFDVLGHHPISPLRSIQHLLDTWPYYAALALGLLLLPRNQWTRPVVGLWGVSALLLGIETYTSGVAWMLNHIGPGSLLAVAWLVSALPALLTRWDAETPTWSPAGGLAAGLWLALLGLATQGLGFVRIPQPRLPADADRYRLAIEQEFAGQPADSVLLDIGSWVYAPHGVIMKDRGAPAGEAGYTGTADFSGMYARLRAQRYRKILVRNLHSTDFIYDYAGWSQPSGVRDSVLRYYREVRRIPAMTVPNSDSPWFGEISVLEPVPPPAAGRE